MKTVKNHKYLSLLLILILFVNDISGLQLDILDFRSYEVIPTQEEQLTLLKELRQSNSGILFWNGIGEIGEPVAFLASPSALEHFQQEFERLTLKVNPSSSEAQLTIIQPLLNPPSPQISSSQFDYGVDSFTCSNALEGLSEFVPIRRINGTDLYSGLFYKVGMKRFPNGLITWTERKTRDGKNNYVQVDLDPSHAQHYREGGKWFNDVQWAFLPSGCDAGTYTFRNKHDLKALANVVQETKDGYHHVILQRNANESTSILWKPVQTREDGMFLLTSDNYPQGTVSWTETKYGDFSHFIQMSLNDNHRPKYSEGQEWYDDALFQFIPPKPELRGEITGFRFDMGNMLLTYRYHAQRKIVKELILYNRGPYPIVRNVTDILEASSKIRLDFDGKITSFEEIKGILSLPTLRCTPFTAGFKVGSTNSNEIRKTEKFFVESTVKILPGMSVKVSVYVDMAEDFAEDFEAMMIVKGTMDGIKSDYSGVGKVRVPHEVVEKTLKNIGFKSTKISQVQESTIALISGNIAGSFLVDFGIMTKTFTNQIISSERPITPRSN